MPPDPKDRAHPEPELLPPWLRKRRHTLAVSEAFAALGQPAKAARLRTCATSLRWARCPEDGTRRILTARFCRERLCPLCSWRRALRGQRLAAAVFHRAAAAHPRYRWILLTLTQRNVAAADLPAAVDRLLDGWARLTRRAELRAVAGWVRVLEVTHSPRRAAADPWHPHLHAVLWVRPEYWGTGYLPHARWQELWREAAALPYDPVLELHRIRTRAGTADKLTAAAQEVVKYTIKDLDLVVDGDAEATVHRVATLDRALKGRRLIAWGGALRDWARVVRDTAREPLAPTPPVDGGHRLICPRCGGRMQSRETLIEG